MAIETRLPLLLFLVSTLLLASVSFTLSNEEYPSDDPKEEYSQCMVSCQTSESPAGCQVQCLRRYKEQRGDEEDEEETEVNPYFFFKFLWKPRYMSDYGGFTVLESFKNLESPLLRGVENYRIALFSAMPSTFALPHHRDAETIYFVWEGKGTITLVMKDKKESLSIKEGDVIRVPAGTTTYLINEHNDKPLHLAQLYKPLNIPDQFEEFFPAGSEKPDDDFASLFGHPESYYSVFSNDILESAFDTPREQLEKAFTKQGNQGMVLSASKEQLRALSKQSPWVKIVPWSTGSVFNLPSQKPVHSNNYGEFYEARPEEYTKQLQDINVAVTYTEIKPGAMMVPHYNSKAIYLMLVLNGTGRFEMACPDFINQESGRYRKVISKLSSPDVFMIPAGHPVAIVADKYSNMNLRLVGFGINAQNNQRNFLAGQEDNVMRLMEREAKQLAFGEEMEQILGKQKHSYFVPSKKSQKTRQ